MTVPIPTTQHCCDKAMQHIGSQSGSGTLPPSPLSQCSPSAATIPSNTHGSLSPQPAPQQGTPSAAEQTMPLQLVSQCSSSFGAGFNLNTHGSSSVEQEVPDEPRAKLVLGRKGRDLLRQAIIRHPKYAALHQRLAQDKGGKVRIVCMPVEGLLDVARELGIDVREFQMSGDRLRSISPALLPAPDSALFSSSYSSSPVPFSSSDSFSAIIVSRTSSPTTGTPSPTSEMTLTPSSSSTATPLTFTSSTTTSKTSLMTPLAFTPILSRAFDNAAAQYAAPTTPSSFSLDTPIAVTAATGTRTTTTTNLIGSNSHSESRTALSLLTPNIPGQTPAGPSSDHDTLSTDRAALVNQPDGEPPRAGLFAGHSSLVSTPADISRSSSISVISSSSSSAQSLTPSVTDLQGLDIPSSESRTTSTATTASGDSRTASSICAVGRTSTPTPTFDTSVPATPLVSATSTPFQQTPGLAYSPAMDGEGRKIRVYRRDRSHAARTLVRAHPEFRRNRQRFLAEGERSQAVKSSRWVEIALELGIDLSPYTSGQDRGGWRRRTPTPTLVSEGGDAPPGHFRPATVTGLRTPSPFPHDSARSSPITTLPISLSSSLSEPTTPWPSVQGSSAATRPTAIRLVSASAPPQLSSTPASPFPRPQPLTQQTLLTSAALLHRQIPPTAAPHTPERKRSASVVSVPGSAVSWDESDSGMNSENVTPASYSGALSTSAAVKPNPITLGPSAFERHPRRYASNGRDYTYRDRSHAARALVRAHPAFRTNRQQFLTEGENSKDVKSSRWVEIATQLGIDLSAWSTTSTGSRTPASKLQRTPSTLRPKSVPTPAMPPLVITPSATPSPTAISPRRLSDGDAADVLCALGSSVRLPVSIEKQQQRGWWPKLIEGESLMPPSMRSTPSMFDLLTTTPTPTTPTMSKKLGNGNNNTSDDSAVVIGIAATNQCHLSDVLNGTTHLLPPLPADRPRSSPTSNQPNILAPILSVNSYDMVTSPDRRLPAIRDSLPEEDSRDTTSSDMAITKNMPWRDAISRRNTSAEGDGVASGQRKRKAISTTSTTVTATVTISHSDEDESDEGSILDGGSVVVGSQQQERERLWEEDQFFRDPVELNWAVLESSATTDGDESESGSVTEDLPPVKRMRTGEEIGHRPRAVQGDLLSMAISAAGAGHSKSYTPPDNVSPSNHDSSPAPHIKTHASTTTPRLSKQFVRQYQLVEAFMANNGHRVPADKERDTKGMPIGRWVSRWSTQRRRGQLGMEKESALGSIVGWEWRGSGRRRRQSSAAVENHHSSAITNPSPSRASSQQPVSTTTVTTLTHDWRAASAATAMTTNGFLPSRPMSAPVRGSSINNKTPSTTTAKTSPERAAETQPIPIALRPASVPITEARPFIAAVVQQHPVFASSIVASPQLHIPEAPRAFVSSLLTVSAPSLHLSSEARPLTVVAPPVHVPVIGSLTASTLQRIVENQHSPVPIAVCRVSSSSTSVPPSILSTVSAPNMPRPLSNSDVLMHSAVESVTVPSHTRRHPSSLVPVYVSSSSQKNYNIAKQQQQHPQQQARSSPCPLPSKSAAALPPKRPLTTPARRVPQTATPASSACPDKSLLPKQPKGVLSSSPAPSPSSSRLWPERVLDPIRRLSSLSSPSPSPSASGDLTSVAKTPATATAVMFGSLRQRDLEGTTAVEVHGIGRVASPLMTSRTA